MATASVPTNGTGRAFSLNKVPLVLKTAFSAWKEDNVGTYAAALAYYAIFSLAPLLLIAIAIGGAIFGQEAAKGQIAAQISGLVGSDAANSLEGLALNAAKQGSGLIAGVFGTVTLLLGASGVFGQLKATLNAVWGIEAKPKPGLYGLVKDRFLSVAMVFGACFLLVVSLVVSALVAALTNNLSNSLGPVLHVVDFLLSVGVLTLMFAGLFKLVPDAKIRWKDVWFGAVTTAFLLSVGKILIGLYLGKSDVASSFGASGAVILVLLWTNYASQLLFFGAEITKAYADLFGNQISELSETA